MKETNDLFETLASGTACDYISDRALRRTGNASEASSWDGRPRRITACASGRIWQSICSAGRTRSLHRKRRKNF